MAQPAADAVQASVEQMHELGDRIERQRERSSRELAEVRKRNEETLKKAVADRETKESHRGHSRPAATTVVREMSFYDDDHAPLTAPQPAGQAPETSRPISRHGTFNLGFEDDEAAEGHLAGSSSSAGGPAPAPRTNTRRPSGFDDDDFSEQSWLH
jgi:hypothetical protein